MRLEGKVVFISGGAQGMGAAEARLFAAEGAMVAIGDVLEEEGRRVAAQIGEAGGKAIFLALDVTSESQWQDAIAATVAEFGKLDILVNNAGIGGNGTVGNTSVADWDRVMDVNVKGVFLGTRASIPDLRKAGGGSIINISSIAAVCSVGIVAYKTSKAGINAYTQSLAIGNAKYGIRANVIMPGLMETPMAIEGISKGLGVDKDELIRQRNAQVPLRGQMGTAWDIARAALFLASDDASFITGVSLPVDGGQTARVG